MENYLILNEVPFEGTLKLETVMGELKSGCLGLIPFFTYSVSWRYGFTSEFKFPYKLILCNLSDNQPESTNIEGAISNNFSVEYTLTYKPITND